MFLCLSNSVGGPVAVCGQRLHSATARGQAWWQCAALLTLSAVAATSENDSGEKKVKK